MAGHRTRTVKACIALILMAMVAVMLPVEARAQTVTPAEEHGSDSSSLRFTKRGYLPDNECVQLTVTDTQKAGSAEQLSATFAIATETGYIDIERDQPLTHVGGDTFVSECIDLVTTAAGHGNGILEGPIGAQIAAFYEDPTNPDRDPTSNIDHLTNFDIGRDAVTIADVSLAPEIRIEGVRPDRRLATATVDGSTSSPFYIDMITVQVRNQQDLDDVFTHIDGRVFAGSVETGSVQIFVDPQQVSNEDFAPALGRAGIVGRVALEQIGGAKLMAMVYGLRAEGILAAAVPADAATASDLGAPSLFDATPTAPLFDPPSSAAEATEADLAIAQNYEIFRFPTVGIGDFSSVVPERWIGAIPLDDPTASADVESVPITLNGQPYVLGVHVEGDRVSRLIRSAADKTIGFVSVDPDEVTAQFDLNGDGVADLVDTLNLNTLENNVFIHEDHLWIIDEVLAGRDWLCGEQVTNAPNIELANMLDLTSDVAFCDGDEPTSGAPNSSGVPVPSSSFWESFCSDVTPAVGGGASIVQGPPATPTVIVLPPVRMTTSKTPLEQAVGDIEFGVEEIADGNAVAGASAIKVGLIKLIKFVFHEPDPTNPGGFAEAKDHQCQAYFDDQLNGNNPPASLEEALEETEDKNACDDPVTSPTNDDEHAPRLDEMCQNDSSNLLENGLPSPDRCEERPLDLNLDDPLDLECEPSSIGNHGLEHIPLPDLPVEFCGEDDPVCNDGFEFAG